MDDAGVDALREAIKDVHGCDSRWTSSILVREPFWNGEVQLFELVDHPSADQCYAWSQVAGRDRRIHAVLHGPTVENAAQAVRATIMARERTRIF
jgi:hypothetical protein